MAAFDGWLPIDAVAAALDVEPEAVRRMAMGKKDKFLPSSDAGWMRGAAEEADWRAMRRLHRVGIERLAELRAGLLLQPAWNAPPGRSPSRRRSRTPKITLPRSRGPPAPQKASIAIELLGPLRRARRRPHLARRAQGRSAAVDARAATPGAAKACLADAGL